MNIWKCTLQLFFLPRRFVQIVRFHCRFCCFKFPQDRKAIHSTCASTRQSQYVRNIDTVVYMYLVPKRKNLIVISRRKRQSKGEERFHPQRFSFYRRRYESYFQDTLLNILVYHIVSWLWVILIELFYITFSPNKNVHSTIKIFRFLVPIPFASRIDRGNMPCRRTARLTGKQL